MFIALSHILAGKKRTRKFSLRCGQPTDSSTYGIRVWLDRANLFPLTITLPRAGSRVPNWQRLCLNTTRTVGAVWFSTSTLPALTLRGASKTPSVCVCVCEVPSATDRTFVKPRVYTAVAGRHRVKASVRVSALIRWKHELVKQRCVVLHWRVCVVSACAGSPARLFTDTCKRQNSRCLCVYVCLV